MIHVNNLTKSIEGNIILNELNMHVPKGSIYGLVGPNGAGKSTLIRTLVGTYKTDSGEITIGGAPVYENTLTKGQIAYIPDDIFYHIGDSIISLMKLYRGLYPGFDKERFYKLMSLFPMLNERKLVRSYSKGMQRQAALILALSIHPKVMILDEPLDGLDPVMRRQILSLLVKDVSEQETTILISSHNLRELEDICDHVGIMEKGKIMIEHTLSDLQDSIAKIQIAFSDGELPPIPEGLEVLHKVTTGKVHTIIVKGEPGKAEEILMTLNPVLMDVLPLTLEEIFIYEMGGANYGVFPGSF